MTVSEEQQKVIDAVDEGFNVFLTGGGGVGKSFLINKIVQAERQKGRVVAITASTGVAADHIGGTTLHSLLGVGLASEPLPDLIRTAMKNSRVRQRWRKIHVLIIDEISMIDPAFFEKADNIIRALRVTPTAFFGGIQLLVAGDFFQLPPVNTQTFCFQSPSWVFDKSFYLQHSFRQARDTAFADLLARARVGDCIMDDIETLVDRIDAELPADGIEPTRMHPRRTNVHEINLKKLADIPSSNHVFNASFAMHTSDPVTRRKLEQMSERMRELNTAPAPVELHLRQGAQVMLLCNLDIERGLVNGSRGVVSQINERGVVVKFARTQSEVLVETHTWEFPLDDKGWLGYTQIPLQLAWAITIHKAQGLSLDRVEMALDNSIFEKGQAYVALSRVTSLAGLRLLSFRPSVIVAHPTVKAFYNSLVAVQ